MSKIRQTINPDGTITFSEHQTAYLQKNAGKQCFITLDLRSSVEKQRFFEGAVVPFFYYQHNVGVFESFADARYVLKKIANHTEFRINEKGKQEEVVRSMSEIYESNTKTVEFLDKVQDYFIKNAYDFPDSSHYNDWRDTLTSERKNEIYPPLAILIEEYRKQIKEDIPAWHQKQ